MIVDNSPTKRFLVKVFISHSSADKPSALKLARWLKRKHIFAYLDEAPNVTPGGRMPSFDRGADLSECRVLCICLTEACVDSRWISRTVHAFNFTNGDHSAWSAAVEYFSTNESAKSRYLFDDDRFGCTIVPCLFEVVNVPPLLVDHRCAHFHASFRAGFNEVLKAVEVENEKSVRKCERRQKRWFDSLLSRDDTKLFLQHFRETGSVYLNDWEPTSYRSLVSHQIMDKFTGDGIPHYVLTALGREFYAYLDARLDKL